MNDRKLVEISKDPTTTKTLKDRVMKVLLNRYERQLYKNWHRLRAQMNDSDLVQASKDDYFSEAYEAFYVAIQKVKLERIEDDNWKLVGMVNWYLANVRSKMIKEIRKKAKVKPSNYMQTVSENDSSASAGVDPDVEEAYWETEGYKTEPSYVQEKKDAEENCKRALAKCLQNWNDEEMIIYKGLLAHKDKHELAIELGCTVSKVYLVVRKMKDELKGYLAV